MKKTVKQDRLEKYDGLCEKRLKDFLKACTPYKIEFPGYKITYLDASVERGEILLKYKLEVD